MMLFADLEEVPEAPEMKEIVESEYAPLVHTTGSQDTEEIITSLVLMCLICV